MAHWGPERLSSLFNDGSDDDDADDVEVEGDDLDDPGVLGLATLPSWGVDDADNDYEALDVVGVDDCAGMPLLMGVGAPRAGGVPGGVGAAQHDGGGGSDGGSSAGGAAAPAVDPPAGAGGGAGAGAEERKVREETDAWDGWFNSFSDDTKGRIPRRDEPNHRFRTANVPPDFPEDGAASGLAAFRLFWDTELVALLLKETNARLRAEAPTAPPVTEQEFWRWLALVITMGISKQPTTASYWSTAHFGSL
jgi:hypothetical protein